MRRSIFNPLVILALVLTAALVPQKAVKADSTVSASDLISMVNSIRTGSYGLPALEENSILDSEAQWTAEEMASIQATTHLAFLGYSGASDRASEWGFGAGKVVFVTENWYGGYYADIGDIQSGWADTEHMYPMTKSEYTYVGAGVATASNGMTYYVLQAGYISGEAKASTSSSSTTSSSTTDDSSSGTTSEWLAPVTTTTPSSDGMVYHVVKANQTLFYIALAYGVTTDYLVQLNGLSSADDIYEGETLKIMYAPTATPTMTFTPTPDYPTRTPTQPTTPTPFPTATATPVPTLLERLPKFDRGTFGFLLVILSAIGLFLILFLNFIKIPKKRIEPRPKEKEEPKPAQEPVQKATPKPVKKTVKKATKKTEDAQPHMPTEIPIKTSRRTTKK